MKKEISELVLRRLPKYIHFLTEKKKEGQEYTSANEISRNLEIHRTQVRKDLSSIGMKGKPKIGHKIETLLIGIKSFLDWDKKTDSFLIGVGNLGKALIGYNGFEKAGFEIVAAFDKNPAIIGKEISGIKILHVDKLVNLIRRMDIKAAVLCTPADVTQEIADVLIDNGIKGIWNFSPLKIRTSKKVIIENIDIYPSLAVLSRKMVDLESQSEE